MQKKSYIDYTGKRVEGISELPLDGDYGNDIYFDREDDVKLSDFKGPWIYKVINESYVKAFYVPNGFFQQKMESQYNEMIAYADCLIDTTTAKIKKESYRGYANMPYNWKGLNEIQKENILDSLRSIRVIGNCSRDQSPRIHAINIALLSAETTNWEVFLKAHLDIMNDRFERTSDGSYAWGARQTYLKELEELGINTVDLILGISLRVDHPSEHHYFGSVRRIGRAISDSKDAVFFEKRILQMVQDESLDLYNRVLMHYVYKNYVYHLDNEILKNQKTQVLNEALESLPKYIASKLLEN